jgi:glyoxylase I family protein
MQFSIKGIDHVVIRCADIDHMIAFYRDVLGCRVERAVGRLGLTQLRAGASLIDLVDASGTLGQAGGAPPNREGRNMDHFCLRIEGFDEAKIREYLEAHGVGVTDSGRRYGAEGVGPSLYLFDPEGNVVELKGPPDPAG